MEAVWESFYQAEKLTTRIHNILREYPPGLGTFKEFLQNADDAGARKFAILFDSTSFNTDTTISSNAKEWQGPALYIYNSASFSKKDFEGIIQVGNSGKISDPKTIGKYGLGFNCAYHLTDLVSFISLDQLVMFDPHGEFLPDNLLGLRCSLSKLNPTQFADTILPFKWNEFNSFDIPYSIFDGTLFRLPLRTSEQAEKSLLSSCRYTNDEVLSLLSKFIDTASEMMLFLNNIEDINVYYRGEDNEVLNLGHIYISNIDDIRNTRQSRNFVDGNVSLRSNYRLNIEKEIFHKNIFEIEEWVISCISRNRELSAEELSIDPTATIQWANVAARLDNPSSNGVVYCSLPLPITTGYPIHINGNFALSSNRRHLWEQIETELSAPAAFKSKWNREITSLVTDSYIILLEELKKHISKPIQLYNYWPCSKESHYFQQNMVPLFMDRITNNLVKLFWDPIEEKWIELNRVIFPDTSISLEDPIYKTLHKSLNLTTIQPTIEILELLSKNDNAFPILSQKILSEILHESNAKLSSKDADIFLDYLLPYDCRSISDFQLENLIGNLDGLKIIPLINNRVGIFRRKKKDFQTKNMILLGDDETINLLNAFPNFVDPNSTCFDKLNSKISFRTNIYQVSPSILIQFLNYVLPENWFKVRNIYISGELLKEEVPNISQTYRKHKKKVKTIPNGLVSAKDPSVSLEDIQKKLDSIWKYLDNSKYNLKIPFPSLLSCPLILLTTKDGCMVSSIDDCIKNGAISYSEIKQKYGERSIELLTNYGCRFYSGTSNTIAHLINRESIKASLFTIIRSKDLNEKRDNRDSLLVRKIILDWSQSFGISRNQIDYLQLFINVSGDDSLCISNSNSILPSVELFPFCSQYLPKNTIDITDKDNKMLLKLGNWKELPLKNLLAYHVCEQLDSLPQSACIEFLRMVGTMKDSESPWFAPTNKENAILIKALETKKIIVYDDGHRCKINDISTSTDFLLQNLFSTDKYSTAPDEYLKDPAIQRILKKMPVKSLSNYDVFEEAARKVATIKNIELGEKLLSFMAKQSNSLKWTSLQISSLCLIRFIPCWDIRDMSFISSKNELPVQYSSLCSLEEGIPISELQKGWTQYPIFTPIIDSIPAKFQNKLRICKNVPTSKILEHVVAVQSTFKKRIPKDLRIGYKRMVNVICKRLDAVTKKHAAVTVDSIKTVLSNCPFIMLEEGELVCPYQLCFDLEEDLGPFARAVPEYLKSYHKLFSLIGTPMITELQSPSVEELDNRPPIASELLINSKNSSLYSDLVFIQSENSFYAHRMVVCPICPTLERMFLSKLPPSLVDGRYQYILPEWTNWNAFLILMDYCYTGNPQFTRNIMYDEEKDVMLMTELLRLSDWFLMDHLKSYCEVFLSKVQVDVFNICNLLQISEMCNASQLVEYCIHSIQVMFSTVQETDEWKELPGQTKDLVLSSSLFNTSN